MSKHFRAAEIPLKEAPGSSSGVEFEALAEG